MPNPSPDPILGPPGPEARDPWQAGKAALAVALATAGGFLVQAHLDLADVAMLYILCITYAATRFGRGAALFASLLSVGCLDFFFIPPRFTLAVQDARHVGTFAVMLGVGYVVAGLAERIRAQSRLAQDRERHARALYRFGEVLAEGGSATALQARVEAYLTEELGIPVLVLLPGPAGTLRERSAAGFELDAEGWGAAQWTLVRGLAAGNGTDTLPGVHGLFLPMRGSEAPVGVLALHHPFPAGPMAGDPKGLCLALAAQTSLALERARLAEERTEARIRAEHEQLKSTLLSSVSHDLRTPLGTITGACTSLLDPGPEANPVDQRLLLESIHEESGRLERLVNNLLELTKLESGQVRVKKEWVPLEEVVGSAVGRLEERLGVRPVQLRLGEAWVPLDPVLMEQVLLNLLDNALKFSPPGSPIEVEGWVEPDRALLRLTDHGPGFLPGEEERVFEKLVRGGRAAAIPGAGLGLAICRGIIQAHGGSIRAGNAAGGGAELLISLPVAGTPPALEAEP
jgi:two-component system sensor histidine kinase KdpD